MWRPFQGIRNGVRFAREANGVGLAYGHRFILEAIDGDCNVTAEILGERLRARGFDFTVEPWIESAIVAGLIEEGHSGGAKTYVYSMRGRDLARSIGVRLGRELKYKNDGTRHWRLYARLAGVRPDVNIAE